MQNIKELLNSMVWIISKENEFIYEKKIGRRHKECLDDFIKKEKLPISSVSEYDALVKLASLGYCTVLNNGKDQNGYIGICVVPEELTSYQKNFFKLSKVVLDEFNIFQISILKENEIISIDSNKTFYNEIIEKQSLNKQIKK